MSICFKFAYVALRTTFMTLDLKKTNENDPKIINIANAWI